MADETPPEGCPYPSRDEMEAAEAELEARLALTGAAR